MNAAENNLVHLLTGQPSLQAATITQLEEITNQHPYFSIGWLLLTKKLKEQGSEQYSAHYRRCALQFPDQLWLQYQLGSAVIAGALPESLAETPEVFDKSDAADNQAAGADDYPAVLPGDRLVEDANLITLPAQDVLTNIAAALGDIKDEPELPPLDEEEAEAANLLTPDASKIADLLQYQANRFNTPLNEKAALSLSPEPLHTIDYFASQGIKIDTRQPEDMLAKKVHTFTDWLKQMKRINQYPTDLGSDPDTESFVQSIANSSNQPREVHTEAMAEVLVKQGKTEKAIEVYQKLSLLNPAKTAYFAAKIHQLKAE